MVMSNQSERPSVMCVPENNLHDFGSDHSRQVLTENGGVCGTASNYL